MISREYVTEELAAVKSQVAICECATRNGQTRKSDVANVLIQIAMMITTLLDEMMEEEQEGSSREARH